MPKLYNKQSMTRRRQELRRSAPPAEAILWSYLKGRQLRGYKFRRQYSVGGYVVDFYCTRLRLAIEVDGPTHYVSDEVRHYDKDLQKLIESFRIQILRVTNSDIYHNINGVIEAISKLFSEK